MAAARDLAADVAEALDTNLDSEVRNFSEFYSGVLREGAPAEQAYVDRGRTFEEREARKLLLFSVKPAGADVTVGARLPNMVPFLAAANVLPADMQLTYAQTAAVNEGARRFLRGLLQDGTNNTDVVQGLLNKRRYEPKWAGVLPDLAPGAVLDIDDASNLFVVEGARLRLLDAPLTTATLNALRDNVEPTVTSVVGLFSAVVKAGAPIQRIHGMTGPQNLFSVFPYSGDASRVRISPHPRHMKHFLELMDVLEEDDEVQFHSADFVPVCIGICRFVQELLRDVDNNHNLVADILDKKRADAAWKDALPSLTRSSWLTVDDSGFFLVVPAPDSGAADEAEPDLASLPTAARSPVAAVPAAAAPATPLTQAPTAPVQLASPTMAPALPADASPKEDARSGPAADATPIKAPVHAGESLARLELAHALDKCMQYGRPVFIRMIRLPGRRHMVVDFTPGAGLVVARAGARLPAGTADPDHATHRAWCLEFLEAMTPEASGTDWYRRDTVHGCLKLIVEARAPYTGPLTAFPEPEPVAAAAAAAAAAACTRDTDVPAVTAPPAAVSRPGMLQSPASRTPASPAADSGFGGRGGAATGGAGTAV